MKIGIFLALLVFVACTEPSENKTNKTEAADSISKGSSHGLTWQVPADWVVEQSSSSMRIAQFSLPHAGPDTEDASVVIFYFQGQGGGVDANIQRWISQFKQSDVSASPPEKKQVNDMTQTLVDVTGTYLFKTRPMIGS